MRILLALLLCCSAAVADTTGIYELSNGTTFISTVREDSSTSTSVVVPLPNSSLVYQIDSNGKSSTTFIVTQPSIKPCLTEDISK